MQPTDTSAIQRLIAQARRRIRSQWALEGATTASIVAAAAALSTIFAMRVDAISTGAGIGLLIGCAGVILIGALIGALRKIDDETVARRIDRASNLSDRLSTAIDPPRDRLVIDPPQRPDQRADQDQAAAADQEADRKTHV